MTNSRPSSSTDHLTIVCINSPDLNIPMALISGPMSRRFPIHQSVKLQNRILSLDHPVEKQRLKTSYRRVQFHPLLQLVGPLVPQ